MLLPTSCSTPWASVMRISYAKFYYLSSHYMMDKFWPKIFDNLFATSRASPYFAQYYLSKLIGFFMPTKNTKHALHIPRMPPLMRARRYIEMHLHPLASRHTIIVPILSFSII